MEGFRLKRWRRSRSLERYLNCMKGEWYVTCFLFSLYDDFLIMSKFIHQGVTFIVSNVARIAFSDEG